MEANKGEPMGTTFLIFGLGVLVGMVIVTVFFQGRSQMDRDNFGNLQDNIVATEKRLAAEIAKLAPATSIETLRQQVEDTGEILKRIEARPAPEPTQFKLPETINFNVTERRTIHSRTVAPAKKVAPAPTQTATPPPLPTGNANKKLPGIDKVKKQVQELSQ